MKPYSLHTCKMEEVLTSFQPDTFDSCVTDPPYGIRFMGKAWDSFDIEKNGKKRDSSSVGEKRLAAGRLTTGFGNSIEARKYNTELTAMRQFQSWTQMWAEHVYRVLKPGAYLIVFASPRTYHRMVCGLEDAGFEIRDQIFWIFASGFPKSSNQKGDWEGWGSSLKPAHEPICVARKPLAGTIPENLAKYGTGAINIKASMVPGGGPWLYGNQPKLNGARYQPGQLTPLERHAENVIGGDNGRWPANLIHDGSEEVIALFPESAGQQGQVGPDNGDKKSINCYGDYGPRSLQIPREESELSAARFFYAAKTSRLDRNEGCEKLLTKPLLWSSGTKNPGSFQSEGTDKSSKNNHPTVKPTTLMRYLNKLVTRPGGHILDPFCGSGSTGKAALLDHYQFTGIDQDENHIVIANARCEFALRNRSNQIGLF